MIENLFYSIYLSFFFSLVHSQQRNVSPKRNNGYLDTQRSYPTRIRFGNNVINDDENGNFDPDERQIRILLKENLKFFNMNGTINFDKLYYELKSADKNQTGFLNRQQIEEVVYKVRIPLQRSLIFQILEKHCRAYSRLYKWEAFIQYLQEQILDFKDNQENSNQIYRQVKYIYERFFLSNESVFFHVIEQSNS